MGNSAYYPAVVIYFAAAIRGGRGDQALYSQIIDLLRAHGRVLTEHVGDAHLTQNGERAADADIHDRDLAWLRSADIIVAEIARPRVAGSRA